VKGEAIRVSPKNPFYAPETVETIAPKWDMGQLPTHRLVTKEFLAFFSEKTAGDGNAVIALLEDEPAGDETSSPLVVLRTALASISGNVFLGNAVDDRAN
jgi:hypothetical protein